MSYPTPHEQRLDVWVATVGAVAETMTDYKWEITKDAIISILLCGLAYQSLTLGYSGPASIFGIVIGAINTITFADVMEVVKGKKRDRLNRSRADAEETD